MSKAIEDVLSERKRQIEEEHWTSEHDDKHEFEELAFAADVFNCLTYFMVGVLVTLMFLW